MNNLRTELGTFAAHPPKWKEVVKLCGWCGQKLVLRNNRDIERRNYCSHSCRAKGAARTEAFSTKEMRICRNCSTDYMATKAAQKYCSVKCCNTATERSYRQRTSTPEGFFRRLTRSNHRRAALTPEFLLGLYEKQQGCCALSGIRMTTISGKGHILTNVSIDRIDSSKEYEQDNVQLVCHIVNLMKHNMTVEQLVLWCRRIIEHSKG